MGLGAKRVTQGVAADKANPDQAMRQGLLCEAPRAAIMSALQWHSFRGGGIPRISETRPMPVLTGPERLPAAAPKRLVIFLHGLGADGNDLIGLADQWAPALPETAFFAPHAPEPCDMAPMGRQWFSLQSRTPESMLAGTQGAAPMLDAYIDAQCARFALAPGRVALVGFSQGTMMSLYVSLRRPAPLACVLGYSGALLAPEALAGELRARPPLMLIHGDADDLVPVAALHGAVAALGAAGVAVQWHISPGIGHGIAPDGLAIGGTFLGDHLIRGCGPAAQPVSEAEIGLTVTRKTSGAGG